MSSVLFTQSEGLHLSSLLSSTLPLMTGVSNVAKVCPSPLPRSLVIVVTGREASDWLVFSPHPGRALIGPASRQKALSSPAPENCSLQEHLAGFVSPSFVRTQFTLIALNIIQQLVLLSMPGSFLNGKRKRNVRFVQVTQNVWYLTISLYRIFTRPPFMAPWYYIHPRWLFQAPKLPKY